MRVAHTRSHVRLLCCLLSYTLVAGLLAPPAQMAEPRAVEARGAGSAPNSTVTKKAQSGAPRRAGELIVRFREDVSELGRNHLASSRGARRKARLRGESRAEKLELLPGQDAAAVAEQLALLPDVELAEPNFLVTRDDVVPGDIRFPEQWALKNTGQSGGTVGSDIHATSAWQETTGSQSTVVAVVDSGIDFSHPDLSNNRWTNPAETPGNGRDDDNDGLVDDSNGWDWVTGSGVIRDDQGHGTALAGIIAAEGNNVEGISGVMWRASLMSLRVLDSTGTGDVASAVEAIDYAVAHGAQVINCSWGMDAESQFLKDAIRRAGRRGVVVVTSAGNDGRDIDVQPYYPASYDLPNLITVASSDGFDNLAYFSNRGALRVTVAAPGTDVLTTQPGGSYSWVTGTSASAPIVAGIAGLIKTLRPDMPAPVVRASVIGGARRVVALSGKVSSGGVADAAGALAALRSSPYGGNGNSGGNGNGNGNGQGNGNGRSYVPPALRRDNEHGRARGRGGRNVDPPPSVSGAPGDNLPNLDASRRTRTSPSTSASAPIRANLMCADCDPSGGGGAGGSDPYFATARSRKRNETGNSEVTLGSRNFNWALPIVGLPGRSGLDLSVVLYYNSLVWTRQGDAVEYNADHGTPAPGFQLGLPRLQGGFFDSDGGGIAFNMVTSSGGRVKMNRVGTSNVYESLDGNYTQLTFSGATPVVRTTDGTQYVFGGQAGSEYRCTQVKDRNGNYLSASYHATNGHLLSITDTLGRVVGFNYDGDGNLSTITQTWAGVTHTYATFIYGSVAMSPNFPGLSVYGPQGGAGQTVLSYVALANNESFHFDYNTYGQVYQVRHKAPDGHELGHTRYNLSNGDLGGAAQTDCPRFTSRFEYAQDWNSNQEAVTTYSVTEGTTWINPETGAQETGNLVQQTTPDGIVYKVFSHASGWDTGLPRLSEVWATENGVSVRKKWTSVNWTQDDTTLLFAKNPRATETNVYDGANRRRTTIDYVNGYSLPTHVREFGGADGQTYLRMWATAYKMDADYINRRIIGLPYERLTIDGPTGNIMSRAIFHYDWGSPYISTQAPSTQYDSVNYPSSFITGRGNLVAVRRYNCTNNTTAYDENQGVWAQLNRYNMAGSPTWVEDAGAHYTTISYADSFSDTSKNSLNTLAYPTSVTDPDGYSSTTQYNFDFGAVTRTHTPTSGTGAGITYVDAVMLYDSFGRLERVTNQTNNAYKKWVYDTSYNYVHTYETITGTTQADEFHSWQVLDGAGRVRGAASDHPGSVGGFSGQYLIYDNVGRLAQRSNPTEMTGQWAAAGDDAAWVYTAQGYDWKGRPTQTTNPDGTTRVMSYGGCGCAGGEVTTAQDEHGRQRRMTKDVQGRLSKVEELNWNASVYSTTNYTYNSRDQITQISQQGQLRTFDYDGHGRLWHKTTPEQGQTTFAYNADDTTSVVTDARGATQTYGYNGRHLVTSINYGVPTGVAATPNVTFQYDAAGNRTQMTDGMGTATYHYDNLSRMDWEERAFTGAGTYRLTYGYNVGGELTSLTNMAGVVVSYGYDKAGRLSAVNGSGYAGVTNYASALSYRAFGSLKGMSYSNGKSFSASYDNRLRPTSWNVSNVLGYNYSYNYFNEKTGRVTYAQSIYDATLDRSYEYDQVGRLAVSHSGTEARAHAYSGQWGITDGPFSQGYDYDVWGNVTHRYGWGGEVQGGSPSSSTDIYNTYTNNRRVGFTYDAAGNLTNDLGQTFAYDAAGRQASSNYTNLQNTYDGDGLRVKRTQDGSYPALYLRSSVLGGQVVAEIDLVNSVWTWWRGYVYAGSQLLAVQQGGVFFVHEDPVTKSKRVTNTSGVIQSWVELDPFGADTSRSSNSAFQPRKFTTYERDANGSDEAMFRRYNRWHSRFDQPDPYDGSYSLTNPQSFNRYSYVQNDPVNFVDPTGLEEILDFGDVEVINVRGRPWRVGGGGGPLFGGEVAPEESGDGPGGTVGGGTPTNTTPDEITIQTLKDNCAIAAMLDALAYAEGNPSYGTVVRGKVTKSPNDSSLVGQRDVTITDFSRHPGITVQVQKDLYSTAAGRYQFKAGTWASLGLLDFSPASQDEGARILMGRRGMIEPLLAGDFAKAVEKGNREWASLPGSPYGQPTKTLDELKGVYDQSYNTCVSKVFGIR